MSEDVFDMSKDGFKQPSPTPWAYFPHPFNHKWGDWIEDANGMVILEHPGSANGPLICAAVNAYAKDKP